MALILTLHERIDKLLFDCRQCIGSGRWEGGLCPFCFLARKIRDEVYKAYDLPPTYHNIRREVADVVAWPDGSIEPATIGDALTGIERKVVVTLIRKYPLPAKPHELLTHIGEHDHELNHMTRVHIARTRQKLLAVGAPLVIITVTGYGYRIAPLAPAPALAPLTEEAIPTNGNI